MSCLHIIEPQIAKCEMLRNEKKIIFDLVTTSRLMHFSESIFFSQQKISDQFEWIPCSMHCHAFRSRPQYKWSKWNINAFIVPLKTVLQQSCKLARLPIASVDADHSLTLAARILSSSSYPLAGYLSQFDTVEARDKSCIYCQYSSKYIGNDVRDVVKLSCSNG